ncbi:hypothetical protein GR158_11640 [Shinella sp. AETb1-6]|nr:hypothetical protein [Shinella sp. AETb1-6]
MYLAAIGAVSARPWPVPGEEPHRDIERGDGLIGSRHGLTDRIYARLRSVTPKRLKGSASPLVIETLAAIYSCPGN